MKLIKPILQKEISFKERSVKVTEGTVFAQAEFQNLMKKKLAFPVKLFHL